MNAEPPVLEELVPGATRLYFLFGGISAGLGMPPFEFYNSSRIVNEHKVFLRDFSQCWYQNGLPGIGRDIYGISEYLKKKIDQLNPEEVVFVGNSMGGYAAILFAALVGVGRAIAFSPQTFISPGRRVQFSDRRWPWQVTKTYLFSAFKRHVWNLYPWLLKKRNLPCVDIFVSNNDRHDYNHAQLLRSIIGVTIHEYDVGGHELVKYLRESGQLSDILWGKLGN